MLFFPMLGQGLEQHVLNVYQAVCAKENPSEYLKQQYLAPVREAEAMQQLEIDLTSVEQDLNAIAKFKGDGVTKKKVEEALLRLIPMCLEALMKVPYLNMLPMSASEVWKDLSFGLDRLRNFSSSPPKYSENRQRKKTVAEVTNFVLKTLSGLLGKLEDLNAAVGRGSFLHSLLTKCIDVVNKFINPQFFVPQHKVENPDALGSRLEDAFERLCKCALYVCGCTVSNFSLTSTIFSLKHSSFACLQVDQWKKFADIARDAFERFDNAMKVHWPNWRADLNARRTALSLEVFPQQCRFWAAEMVLKIKSSISSALSRLAGLYAQEEKKVQLEKEEISRIVDSIIESKEPQDLAGNAQAVYQWLHGLVTRALQGNTIKVLQDTDHIGLLIPLHVKLIAEVERFADDRQRENDRLRAENKPVKREIRRGAVLTYANASQPFVFAKKEVITRAFRPWNPPRRMCNTTRTLLSTQLQDWHSRVKNLVTNAKLKHVNLDKVTELMSHLSKKLIGTSKAGWSKRKRSEVQLEDDQQEEDQPRGNEPNCLEKLVDLLSKRSFLLLGFNSDFYSDDGVP